MFFNIDDFPALRQLEHHWQVVRDELRSLQRSNFMPWPERDIYEGTWDVFGLYLGGQRIDANAVLCPQSTQLLEAMPGMVTGGFSTLAPGAHILPHSGYTDTVLRGHLGLVVPDTDPNIIGLRVGNDLRGWKEGDVLVFDDTQEHEAWNRADYHRIVLLFDFVRSGAAYTPNFSEELLDLAEEIKT